MAKKQFKTESKKLLDMMINSIYTHKEIFLRELISNASDAIDKLYYKSLTDSSVTLGRGDYEIRLTPDREARTLTISDNGCGMGREELENNLGTIAKSGSFDFKKNEGEQSEVDIIGQFGVGFYSAFMVSDRITVESRAWGAEEAWRWVSEGVDGYTVEPCEKASNGTTITLHIKPDTDDEQYGEYLDDYRIEELVKKYSDYIRYPVRMLTSRQQLKEGSQDEYETVEEDKTLNSMIPLWKKNPSEVTDEEYATFYRDKFYDWEAPAKVIRQKSEGGATFEALLFIPKKAPYNYYTKDYEKGLQLYSSGVMIMEKCKDLLPDYFSFVRGLVDSADLTLNISRETLQHDRQLRVIAKAVEKKIASELAKMLKDEREAYEAFFRSFGMQLKYGVYSDYGTHKEVLQDLILFVSSHEGKYVTLKEYVGRMKEGQSKIYFAGGENVEKVAHLPQVEAVVAKGYEVLYLTDDIDEFALQMLREYDGKQFSNVCTDALDLASEEEKETLKQENEKNEEILKFMKDSIGDAVKAVRFSNTLGEHAVCLSSEGNLSIEMEKVLNRMPGAEEGAAKAQTVLEINLSHPIAAKIKELYVSDRDRLANYAKILFSGARLISGLTLDDPAAYSDLVCTLMV
jgi:molecular chaperone HtpG